MDRAIPFKIQIEHKEAVSMAVVVEAISTICAAVASASHDIVDHFGGIYEINDELLARIHHEIDRLREDVLWLERVDAGSSIFKGVMLPVAMTAMSIVGSTVASDVIRASPTYQDFIKTAQSSERDFEDAIRAYFKRQAQEHDRDNHSAFEVLITQEKLEVVVRPPRMKSRIDAVLKITTDAG